MLSVNCVFLRVLLFDLFDGLGDLARVRVFWVILVERVTWVNHVGVSIFTSGN